MVEIPLYGKIAAGTPIEAIANESERFSVPYDMVSRGQYYALTVEGDSMVNIGIMDGDIVIIKKADTANNGDIVVALVDESEATLKEIKKENGEVLLIPKNDKLPNSPFSRIPRQSSGNFKQFDKNLSLTLFGKQRTNKKKA